MKMRIDIQTEIPDDIARQMDDGFGEPASTVSSVVLQLLQRQVVANGLFQVNANTVVKTEVPELLAVGISYGKNDG